MAKGKSKRRRGGKSRDQVKATPTTAASGLSTVTYVGGILLLAVCVISSTMLALEHLGGLSLPGCGEGSACAEAAASVWGKVPYINWPVSFLGLAYFLGLLGVWLSARRGIPGGVHYLVRFGVLISLAFIVVMIVGEHVCQYCVATHVGNFVFWIIIERAGGVKAGSVRALATLAVVFLVCSGVLGMTNWQQRKAAELKAEEELASSTEAIIAATSQRVETPGEVAEPVVEAAESVEEPARADAATGGFTGRYRLGPEKAAIRVVMVSDYQCTECRRIENEVARLFRQRDDMSVSFKHFPMCSDCNRITKRRAHPNACWAARAAETAGILNGNDAFWEMHFWLFSQRGSFTREPLRAQLRKFGYEIAEFERIMMSDETLEPVKADIEEAIRLGIWFTPTIFINGVELRGWEATNAVARAVRRLAATNPVPMTAARDHPPPAVEKLIGDWRGRPLKRIPPGVAFRSLGPEDATARVVMFGDYLQSGTAETDAVIRAVVAERGDVRYEYRHFPFNKECNPTVKRETDFPHSCRAARAGEAAGRLAGAEGYWKMHVWLLENQESFSDEALRAAAGAMGIDSAALLAEMEKPATGAAVSEDTRVGGRVDATSVPSLYINGRRVPRWKLEGETILPQIIEEAAKE